MSNSNLVNYVKISPNSTNPRNNVIDKITIHHMAGDLSVEACGDIFSRSSVQSSTNYGVGSDGRVGMYVEEENRSWGSSSGSNDHRAVTIEVANDSLGGDWTVSDIALEKTILLCVDICKRNGIERLNWTGNSSGNLTVHRFFTNTACPGEYLFGKMGYIADRVNELLNIEEEVEMVTETEILVNGEVKRVKRILKDGRNYVGLREVCEILGVEVGYDEERRVPVLKN